MKIGIVIYSTYGHVLSLAKEIESTLLKQKSVTEVSILQVPETLTDDILKIIHAPGQDTSIPIIKSPDQLLEFDALLFGFPTRYGNIPSQISAFLDSTGGLWASGALYQKPVGVFVSVGTPGGGIEITIRSFLSFVAHHGMIYVPLGYGAAFGELTSFDEIHGGSPWGASMYAGADGSRSASKTDLIIAQRQAESFVKAVSKLTGTGAAAAGAAQGEEQEQAQAPVAVPIATETTEPAAVDTRKQQSTTGANTESEKKTTTPETSSKCCVIM